MNEKTAILRGLAVFAVMIYGSVGHLKGVEGALNANLGQNNTVCEGYLTDNEAKDVIEIWRVIKTQEIVDWNGEKWLEMSTVDKEEALSKAREAWIEAGYKNIATAEYLVEEVDKYYNYHLQKNPPKAKEEKVGLTLSLSAFFAGMGK